MNQTFVVVGTGRFPFDMLRYDEAWPVAGADANAIGRDTHNVRASDSRRIVRLMTHKYFGPTIGRWESFGWRVLSHDARGQVPADELAAAIAREKGT